MLRDTLSHFGHTVIEAQNGKEGMKLFQDARADLVITDLVMPEKEGFEVLAELQRKRPRVKTIVITGGVRGSIANYLDMARRLGAEKVLAKPFSDHELINAINELLPPATAGAWTPCYSSPHAPSATISQNTGRPLPPNRGAEDPQQVS